MTVGDVFRAVWLVLVVLAWTQSHTVTGVHMQGSSFWKNHSSRLVELMRAASRLNNESQARNKRLVDSGNSDWNDMYDKYKIFHSELSDFISQILGNLKQGSPSELQYMAIIPHILPLDDPDFLYRKKDRAVMRVLNMLKFTERLMHGARQYVAESSLHWYNTAARKLHLWSSLLLLTLNNLKLSDDPEPVHYYDAGMGGINVRLISYRKVNWDHLEALLKIL